MKKTAYIIFMIFVVSCANAYIVKVANPISEPRSSETICVDLKLMPTLIKPFIFCETLKKEIPFQLIDLDGNKVNDEIVFQADFEPNQTLVFRIVDVDDLNQVKPKIQSIAYYVPQRKDDFAWENDKIAFRVYGKELQRTELTSSGIDVWVKSVEYPVMLKLYDKGHDYYHSDNGESLDFFTVGTSLGCGGLGKWADGKLYMPENYSKWKIIANGPIRVIFELTYDSWRLGDKTVCETRRFTLDLGSNFNRIESIFDTDVNDVLFAVGIVKCERGGKAAYTEDKHILSYWQNPDQNFGAIGCAVILPLTAAGYQTAEDKSHNLILLKTKHDSRSITYYAGAGWSRTPRFADKKEWNAFVEKTARMIENPLKVEVLKNRREF